MVNVSFFEQYSDLEKEKTMIELEVKELIARHKSDMSEKGGQISQLEELNQQLTDSLDQKIADKEELEYKIKGMQEGKLSVVCFDIRAVSIKCRKTTTKVITLASRNRSKKHKPIRIRSIYM